MLDPNILKTDRVEQLYSYERLEDLVAILYDVDLKNRQENDILTIFNDTNINDITHERNKLKADLITNTTFQDTLNLSIEAVKSGKIKLSDNFDKKSDITCETLVNTISFTFWYESEAGGIPSNFLDRIQTALFTDQVKKNIIEEEKRVFPKLTPDELEAKKLEPLWFVHDALLYWLHKNNKSKDIKYIANFLERFAHVKELITQLDNAILIGEVKVFADPVITIDNELQTRLLKKIKPLEFIAFVEKITQLKFNNDQILIKEARKFKEAHTNGYTTEYITLMLAAIEHFNITANNQPTKDSLKSWFKLQNDNLSNRILEYMATLVRLPAMQKGGHWRANKLEGIITQTS